MEGDIRLLQAASGMIGSADDYLRGEKFWFVTSQRTATQTSAEMSQSLHPGHRMTLSQEVIAMLT